MSFENIWNNVGALGSSLVSGLGVGMSTAAAYQGAQAENQALERNAQLEEKNAAYYDMMGDNALARGEKEAGDHRRSIELLKGRQRAGFAASGVKVDDGSALDVALDTAAWGEYDAQTILYNSQVEAAGYQRQADNSADAAAMHRQSKRSAGMAAAGVFLNGITPLMRIGEWKEDKKGGITPPGKTILMRDDEWKEDKKGGKASQSSSTLVKNPAK